MATGSRLLPTTSTRPSASLAADTPWLNGTDPRGVKRSSRGIVKLGGRLRAPDDKHRAVVQQNGRVIAARTSHTPRGHPYRRLDSYAPISLAAPWGRPTPRWSVFGAAASSPASMAGLPDSRAWVSVGPPLSCNGLEAGPSWAGRLGPSGCRCRRCPGCGQGR